MKVFQVIVAFDLQGAKPGMYSTVDADLETWAQIYKTGSPANTYTGQIHSADLATAMKTLKDNVTSALNMNGVHGTVRYWITDVAYAEVFDV